MFYGGSSEDSVFGTDQTARDAAAAALDELRIMTPQPGDVVIQGQVLYTPWGVYENASDASITLNSDDPQSENSLLQEGLSKAAVAQDTPVYGAQVVTNATINASLVSGRKIFYQQFDTTGSALTATLDNDVTIGTEVVINLAQGGNSLTISASAAGIAAFGASGMTYVLDSVGWAKLKRSNVGWNLIERGYSAPSIADVVGASEAITAAVDVNLTSVGYKRFGALLDGVASAQEDAAILAAHTYANTRGLKVVAESGTYKPMSGSLNIPVKTDVDLSRLTVVMDDTNSKATGVYGGIWNVSHGTNEQLGATEKTAIETNGVAKGASTIPEALGLGAGFLVLQTDHIDGYRYSGNSSPVKRNGLFRLNRLAEVLTGTQLSVPVGPIQYATFVHATTPVDFTLPIVELDSTTVNTDVHTLVIADNVYSIIFNGGQVNITGTAQRVGALIDVQRIAYVEFNSLVADGRPNTGDGTYIVGYANIDTLVFNQCVMSGGWGCLGGSYVNTLIVNGGVLNRVDIHWQVGDIYADGLELTGRSIQFTGLIGDVRATRCKKIASKSESDAYIVATRGDYGGQCFPGSRIIVEDSKVYGATGIEAGGVKLAPDGRLGFDITLPDIEVRGLKFIDCDAQTTPLFFKHAATSGTNFIKLPKSVIIEDVDITESPLADFHPFHFHTNFKNAEYVGWKDHGGKPNVQIDISRVIGGNTTLIADNNDITLAGNPAQFESSWSGSNAPFFGIKIDGYENLSMDITVPYLHAKVTDSKIIHYDSILTTAYPANKDNLDIQVVECDIQPMHVAGGVPRLYTDHIEYHRCNFMDALDSSGDPVSMNLVNHVGTGNSDNGTYTNASIGFFGAAINTAQSDAAIAAAIAAAVDGRAYVESYYSESGQTWGAAINDAVADGEKTLGAKVGTIIDVGDTPLTGGSLTNDPITLDFVTAQEFRSRLPSAISGDWLDTDIHLGYAQLLAPSPGGRSSLLGNTRRFNSSSLHVEAVSTVQNPASSLIYARADSVLCDMYNSTITVDRWMNGATETVAVAAASMIDIDNSTAEGGEVRDNIFDLGSVFGSTTNPLIKIIHHATIVGINNKYIVREGENMVHGAIHIENERRPDIHVTSYDTATLTAPIVYLKDCPGAKIYLHNRKGVLAAGVFHIQLEGDCRGFQIDALAYDGAQFDIKIDLGGNDGTIVNDEYVDITNPGTSVTILQSGAKAEFQQYATFSRTGTFESGQPVKGITATAVVSGTSLYTVTLDYPMPTGAVITAEPYGADVGIRTVTATRVNDTTVEVRGRNNADDANFTSRFTLDIRSAVGTGGLDTMLRTDLDDLGLLVAEITPSVRTTTGADTSTDDDFGGTILMADTHTVALHSVTETTRICQTITFRLRGATQQTIGAGTATIEGAAIIDQHETVTATLYEVGAGTATVWGLTGGSSA